MTNVIDTTSLPALDAAGRALLFTDARTAGSFSDVPVTDAELAQIWELAKWAPTAANTQPLRVLYVQTPQGRERLVGHLNEGNRAKTAAAPAVAVLAIDTRFHEHIPTVFPVRPEMEAFFESDEAARTDWAEFSGALQAGYFVLAVRALGLAAGPMTGFDKAGLDAEFFGDGRFRSVMVVNIGHPAADAWRDRLPRLDNTDVLRWA